MNVANPDNATSNRPSSRLFDRPDVDPERSRLTDNYPDAFTDTYGTVSGAPFVYNAWSKREGGRRSHTGACPPGPQGFTAITGIGWANVGDGTPFCPLLLIIRVAPKTVVFEAKISADYVKSTILDKAGFPDIECTTSFSGIGPKLPSFNPSLGHPFASTLGLVIAHLKKPYCEGTIVLYLRHGNESDDALALTAAHAACFF